MQTFMCTTSEVKCREHAEAKHPKADVLACFPHLKWWIRKITHSKRNLQFCPLWAFQVLALSSLVKCVLWQTCIEFNEGWTSNLTSCGISLEKCVFQLWQNPLCGYSVWLFQKYFKWVTGVTGYSWTHINDTSIVCSSLTSTMNVWHRYTRLKITTY